MSPLGILLILLVLLLLLGGGWYGRGLGYAGPYYYGGFGIGGLLLLILVLWLLGVFR